MMEKISPVTPTKVMRPGMLSIPRRYPNSYAMIGLRRYEFIKGINGKCLTAKIAP